MRNVVGNNDRKEEIMTFNLKTRAFLVMVGCLASPFACAVPAGADTAATQRMAGYGRLPLQFELNRGQAPGAVRFLSRGKGYSLFLTPTEAVLAVHRVAASAASEAVVRMKLLGANAHPRMTAMKPLPGLVNYLIGSDRRAWRRRVPTYARAAYGAAYPGIDLVYYGNQGQLEYDFLVAPGGGSGPDQGGIWRRARYHLGHAARQARRAGPH